MHICLTHHAFYPTAGGVETHLLDLGAELVRRGHSVHALVGSLTGEPAESTCQGIQVHRADWMKLDLLRARKQAAGIELCEPWPRLQLEIEQGYRRFVREHGIEVIHAHNFHHSMPEYGLALTALRRADGIPTVLTIHEMWGEYLCERLLQRTHWDRIVCMGQHVYGDLVAQTLQAENAQVVLHGVNTEMFHPGLDSSALRKELGLNGHRVLLHPARLLPRKGVHTTVEAFRRIADRCPEAVLVITATHDTLDGTAELRSYRERIRALIGNDGLSKRVLLRSFDFFTELPQAYAMADVVLYPSSGEEPFGLVPLEAMASGKPVVVTRSGGLTESVVDGVTGFVIPKEDPEMLADRMVTLLRRPALARRMGQAGRVLAQLRFSRTRMAQEMAGVYLEAAAPVRGSVAQPVAAMV